MRLSILPAQDSPAPNEELHGSIVLRPRTCGQPALHSEGEGQTSLHRSTQPRHVTHARRILTV